MPQIGEVRKGIEVGYKTLNKCIWIGCKKCGKERWVRLVNGLPDSEMCHQCHSEERKEYIQGEKNPNWKGGNIHCSNGYIKVYQPNHSRKHIDGYVYEHIIIWERVNGKSLPKGWVIHHLNGIKNDNRPVNLLAMPSLKHNRLLSEKSRRIRELESEVKLLEKTLSECQMIFTFGEN